MICVDNTFLGLLLHPESRAPLDPKTGQPIERLAERLNDLTNQWISDNEKVIIPAPVLSEFLVLAMNQAQAYLEEIHAASYFVIKPFDERAAVELAVMQALEKTGKAEKKRLRQNSKAKVKFDRQIVAIAKIHRASTIYSDDEGVADFAEKNGIAVTTTWTLPPPVAKQMDLNFDGSLNPKQSRQLNSRESMSEPSDTLIQPSAES